MRCLVQVARTGKLSGILMRENFRQLGISIGNSSKTTIESRRERALIPPSITK
jgi:hypothetical protein